VRSGVCLVDATPGADLFAAVVDGETVTVRAGGLWRNGTQLAEGVELTEHSLVRALADQQSRVTEALEAFADNTLRHLRDEGKLLADGIDFPPLTTKFRDRHAVVVARGPGYKSDLRIVRPYIRNFKPVLVAVDGGADALLEIGLKPHVIVGDFDSVSDAALKTGAELLVHAYADGRAPGSERLTSLGLTYSTVSAPGISEDIAPELLTSRLSRYFEALGAAISGNHGMIDKYIGDSVMAFWNAPELDPDHVVHACRAALQAAAASRALADKWRGRGRPGTRGPRAWSLPGAPVRRPNRSRRR
jgi:uncharacterized membrane-anchored protein